MDSVGPITRNDPEFESSAATPGLRAPHIDPAAYLRLVANPFLAIFGFVGWLLALFWLRHLDIDRELLLPLVPIIAVVFLAALWRISALFQYHCLDCGATGRLSRWREHLCPASVQRRDSGVYRRIRGPSLFVQIILWLWGLLAFGLVASAKGWLWFLG